MSRVIAVCKADALGSELVEDTSLLICEELPRTARDPSEGWEKRLEEFHDEQARRIVDALSHLPGGTMHRLLIRLLERKQDLYRGRYVPANHINPLRAEVERLRALVPVLEHYERAPGSIGTYAHAALEGLRAKEAAAR